MYKRQAPQHGLEMREGQQDMSFEIVDALINDQHFAIDPNSCAKVFDAR